MYCPNCSQQQPSSEMRYCSRCGFTLTAVALVMENNGSLPQSLMAAPRSSRNRIMMESAVFTVFTWAIAFTSTFWFNASGIGEGIAKFAGLLFFILGLIGMIRFLFGFLFAKDVGVVASGLMPGNTRPSFHSASGHAELPPPQSILISDYQQRPNTNEITPRPSVTENTTRLLDD
jgi:hypothetical protein